MSNALITLSHIAADASEFAQAARKDGFDAADALARIEAAAELASKRIAGIPRKANVLVAAILMQDEICDDVLDLADDNLDMLLRDWQPARAVRDRLQAFVDAQDGPDVSSSQDDDEMRDRCLDLIDRIDAVHPLGTILQGA